MGYTTRIELHRVLGLHFYLLYFEGLLFYPLLETLKLRTFPQKLSYVFRN